MNIKLSFTLLIIFLCINLNLYSQDQNTKNQPIKISDNLYAITSLGGGNNAFLVTNKGIIVVDATFLPSDAKELISIIRTISNKPITHLILTHSHIDHINGMGGFPDNIKIIAHTSLSKNFRFAEIRNNEIIADFYPTYLQEISNKMDAILDKNCQEYLALKKGYDEDLKDFKELKTLKFRDPDIVFSKNYIIELGEEKVILEYLGPGHTSDNIVVKFPNHNAIHTGDLIFVNAVPFVRTDHGANTQNWIKILKTLHNDNFDHVIPGHGEIGNGDLLKVQIEYFIKLTKKIQSLKSKGYNLDQVKEEIDIIEFGLTKNANQFPINIEAIFNEL